ncbi:MAG: MerR family DNA-binding transcriptional regulator [Chloroflexota bacterium]|nr:MerR family DNA-binding transcriptional regulator [Chloroflexota bacterium]
MVDRTTEQFLGIGALSQELGVSPSGVRRWERIGLIPPADRVAGSGRRLYRLSDVQEIRKRVEERAADRRQDGDRVSVAG